MKAERVKQLMAEDGLEFVIDMNKYYTPELEELYIGFEYQQFSHLEGKWNDMILDYVHFITILEEEESDWSEHHIRVKYLDREDIASLGFEHLGSGWFEKDIYRIRKWSEQEIDVYLWHTLDASMPEHLIFRGEIKNRSELKQLLKQLHIK